MFFHSTPQADIKCTVKDVNTGNAIFENGEAVDCNDEDIVSKAGNCEVIMEYCYEASHEGTECLEVTEFVRVQDGEPTDLMDDFKSSSNQQDAKVCPNRANPTTVCEPVTVNLCEECVDSKTTLDVIAMEGTAECPAEDSLDVKNCRECEIEVTVDCKTWDENNARYINDCADENQFSFVGVDECVEKIRLCYTVTNVGSTCATMDDLTTDGLTRTITNGDLFATGDMSMDDAVICPNESVTECEEQTVNSCSCMSVVVEVDAKNPADEDCEATATYGYCKEEESRDLPPPTPSPTRTPTSSPTANPTAKKECTTTMNVSYMTFSHMCISIKYIPCTFLCTCTLLHRTPFTDRYPLHNFYLRECANIYLFLRHIHCIIVLSFNTRPTSSVLSRTSTQVAPSALMVKLSTVTTRTSSPRLGIAKSSWSTATKPPTKVPNVSKSPNSLGFKTGDPQISWTNSNLHPTDRTPMFALTEPIQPRYASQ